MCTPASPIRNPIFVPVLRERFGGGRRADFTPSYTTKKLAALGAEPRRAEGTPAYMLRIVERRVRETAGGGVEEEEA